MSGQLPFDPDNPQHLYTMGLLYRQALMLNQAYSWQHQDGLLDDTLWHSYRKLIDPVSDPNATMLWETLRDQFTDE